MSTRQAKISRSKYSQLRGSSTSLQTQCPNDKMRRNHYGFRNSVQTQTTTFCTAPGLAVGVQGNALVRGKRFYTSKGDRSTSTGTCKGVTDGMMRAESSVLRVQQQWALATDTHYHYSPPRQGSIERVGEWVGETGGQTGEHLTRTWERRRCPRDQRRARGCSPCPSARGGGCG